MDSEFIASVGSLKLSPKTVGLLLDQVESEATTEYARIVCAYPSFKFGSEQLKKTVKRLMDGSLPIEIVKQRFDLVALNIIKNQAEMASQIFAEATADYPTNEEELQRTARARVDAKDAREREAHKQAHTRVFSFDHVAGPLGIANMPPPISQDEKIRVAAENLRPDMQRAALIKGSLDAKLIEAGIPVQTEPPRGNRGLPGDPNVVPQSPRYLI